MDEEMKKRIGVFRFGVIADFVGGGRLSRGETRRLMQEKCARRWEIPGSMRTSISKSVLKDWIARYKRSGNKIESLYPKGRSDIGKSRSMDEDTAGGLIALRKELPDLSIRILLSEAKARKIILPGIKITYSTLYRLLKAQGLSEKPEQEPLDRRRFEAEDPNALWQSDIMHGPYVTVEGKQKKTYLIGFIDDMSRLIPHAEFYLHEQLNNFLDALRKALLIRGIPKKLYVDNGPAFRSLHLAHICASLGIVLLHARPYQPEGKGKIERWFRTVREGFLSTQKADTLGKLNHEFGQWITRYHETTHSITGESPLKRFAKNIACVRPAPRDLEDHFRKTVKRTVAKDRTVALDGRLYEAPVALIGKQISLLYHEHDPVRVEASYSGQTYGFIPVLDVNVNCRIKREQGITEIDTNNVRYNGGRLFKEEVTDDQPV